MVQVGQMEQQVEIRDFNLDSVSMSRNVTLLLEKHKYAMGLAKGKGKHRHSGDCLGNSRCENFNGFTECRENCYKKCSNREIIRGLPNKKLKVVWSEEKGYKLVALETILPDTKVIEYTGFIKSEADYWAEYELDPQRKMYGLEYVSGWYIDATKQGNLSRFVNHSCDPNLRVEVWATQDQLPRMILVAQKTIFAGNELTFDYNADNNKGTFSMDCFCGKDTCRYVPRPVKKPLNGKTLKCNLCPREFGRKYDFLRHMSTTHGNTRPFKCGECNKDYKRKDNLDYHMRRTHGPPAKPLKCSLCQAKLTTKQGLKKHLLTHKEPKEWKCEMYVDKRKRRCLKVYFSEGGLKKHQRTKHR